MLFCGTGMGVGIIANKFSGVYAATVENEAAARNSRAINNSNVLCMGGMVRSKTLKRRGKFLGYLYPLLISKLGTDRNVLI